MRTALTAIGIIIISLGALIGFGVMTKYNVTPGLSIVFSSVVFGVLFLAFAKIIEHLERIESKLDNQYNDNKITEAKNYRFSSYDFEVFNADTEHYPYVVINGDAYIKARVLRTYITQVEEVYQYALPNREPIQLVADKHYVPDSNSFFYNSSLYIKLSYFQITPVIIDDTVILYDSKV